MQKGLNVVTAVLIAESWIDEILDWFRRGNIRKIVQYGSIVDLCVTC